MSAENKYDKFERDLLNATAAKKPKDETEVEKTVDDLLKSTLAGIGIDPEKKKQILQEAEEQAKAKPEPAKPAPPSKADVVGLRPEVKTEKVEKKEMPDRGLRAESVPWAKEPPRPTTFVPPPKHEPPVFKEKAEMPFPSMKKDKVFLEDYGKEKKKSKPIVPIIIGGLVVVVAAVGFLILSGGKEKPSLNTRTTSTEAKPTETIPGPAEAVTGSTTLASNTTTTGTPETKPATEPAGQKAAAAKPLAEIPQPPAEKKRPTETTAPLTDSSAPLMPADTAASKVQEIKPTRTAPADKTPGTTGTETGQPAKPKVILGQLVSLNEVDTAPILVRRVNPTYPPLAQRMNLQGTVKINALIDETGSVVRTEVLQASSAGPSAGFERASQEAVVKWKYKPAVKEGTYVKVWMPVSVSFNIKQ